jgi:PAS domain S-box-containing protein
VAKVLLIEDNAADARLVTEYLHDTKPRRFAVTHAPHLRRAIECLANEGFHAIVLDLGLPDSHGLQTLASARAGASGAPIIVLTGSDDERAGISAVQGGAQDYLVKRSVTAELLRQALSFAIERAQIEATLRDREERFRQLTENMEEVFFVVDSEFREILYISPGYETVWGRSCDSLRERPSSFLDAVQTEDVGALRANIEQVLRGEHGDVMYRIRRPDGELRWIQSKTVPVRDAEERVYRIAGVSVDITERQRAHHALAESEARYRLISETSFDGIAVTEGGILLDVNKGYADLLGYKREELVGQPIVSLVAEESIGHMQRRIKLEESGTYRMIAKHRDGHKLHVEVTANTYLSGTHVRRVSAVRDLTARDNLERQYRQAQKMEAVGRLSGGIAHDFNNLLTVISSYASLLLTENELSAPMREDLTAIGKAAASAAALTRQLLAFSRQQVLELKSVNVNDIVRGAEKILRRVIGEDIEVRTSLDESLGRVRADAGQLEQVIMNMAVNARDAMPDGGRLVFETATIEVGATIDGADFPVHPGAYVLLKVSDSGTGMDEATKSQIFEPFFTTKDVGKGTGLGLSMVYGVVKQSNGYIVVDSAVGQGTSFRIYLPRIDDTEESPTPPNPTARPQRSTETVLLVEDDAVLREIECRVLRGVGYVVLDAADAKSAIALAAEHRGPIHLLLTDVVLPGMGGRELSQELRRARPHIRVLFTSGYTTDAVVRGGIFEAGVAFMQKPFTPQTLLQRVRGVLD